MQDIYAVVEGPFGRVEVREISQSLKTHAHSHIQMGYWVGGGWAHSHVMKACATYSDAFAVAIDSYQSHDFVLDDASNPVVLLLLYLDSLWLHDVSDAIGFSEDFMLLKIPFTTQIRALTWQLMQKIVTKSDRDLESLEQAVLNLICTSAISSRNSEPRMGVSHRKRLMDRRLRVAMSHMQKSIVHDRSIEQLAKLVGLSRSRLYELFESDLGSSPKVIWSCIRIEAAMERLSMRGEDISSIATTLGFSSAGNFSRFFRSVVGVSPMEYRRLRC